jgi:hypothetical protein
MWAFYVKRRDYIKALEILSKVVVYSKSQGDDHRLTEGLN